MVQPSGFPNSHHDDLLHGSGALIPSQKDAAGGFCVTNIYF